jgi:hypothetical protein
MKLNDIVCDLKYAKQLKKLGVKQDSLFYYLKMQGYSKDLYPNGYTIISRDRNTDDLDYPAFTATELLEMLPDEIVNNKLFYSRNIRPYKNSQHLIDYNWFDQVCINIKSQIDKKLPNALAKMLIHLIKNKVIEA